MPRKKRSRELLENDQIIDLVKTVLVIIQCIVAIYLDHHIRISKPPWAFTLAWVIDILFCFILLIPILLVLNRRKSLSSESSYELGILDLLAILSRGSDAWNAWRTSNQNVSINLSGADLSGSDLRYFDLTGADLTGADLTGANLTGADLIGADLSGANLTGAEFKYVNTENIIFDSSTIFPKSFNPKIDQAATPDNSQEVASALILEIDPGTADSEEIQDYLNALSSLYEILGGSGIQFQEEEVEGRK